MLINFIYQLSPLLVTALVLLGTIAISLALVWICRRFIKLVKTDEDALKLKTYSDAFGIAFAILLGLIIVTAWTAYDKTDDYVKSEVNYLSDLYQQAEYLNEVSRKELRQNLRDYVKEVIEVEWPLLPQGKYSSTADRYLFRNFHILYQYKPSDRKEEFIQAQMDKIATDATEKRRSRILNAASSLTSIMWVILIACNLISFLILGLAIRGNSLFHYFLQVLYALGTGLMLLLVIVLDRPFYRLGEGISSEPFEKLLFEWNQEGKK